MDEHRETNLANWESRVAIHVASRDYDVAALASGERQLSDVVAFDAPFLGDLSGLDAVHLQCHIGTDTLSLARLGARITGVDFSPSALEEARELAATAGVDATFVHSELYNAAEALDGKQFDLVYTGVGALNWLPDVRGWARVVAALLRPGGRLYIREGHPMLGTIDDERGGERGGELIVGYPYFEIVEPIVFFTETTYTGDDTIVTAPETREWSHGLGEVVQAVLDAGLMLTRLAEHDFCEWQAMPWMVLDEDRKYRLPEHPERLPLMYTLEARKPG